jgi:hypothetical protein
VGKKGQSRKAKGRIGVSALPARDDSSVVNAAQANIPARLGQMLGLICLFLLPLASGGYSGWGYQLGFVLLPLAALLCLPSLRLTRFAAGACALLLTVAALYVNLVHPAFAGRLLWLDMLALIAAWIVTRSILLENSDAARWLMPTIVASAVLTALAGLFPYWGHWLNTHNWDYMVVSTFGLHNAYAGFLLLAWPIAAIAALQKSGARSGLLWTATVLLLLTLFLTGSRAASFVMVLQVAVYLLLRLQSKWGWKLPATIGAGLILIGAPLAAGAFYLQRHFDYSMQGRLRFWDASLRIFADHPLGIGLGNFRYVYPQYQLDWQYYSVDPHSWILQLLAELGVPGALAVLFILAGFVLWMRSVLRGPFDRTALLAVVAVGGSLAHAAFDFDYTFAATTTLLGVLVAYATSRAREKSLPADIKEPPRNARALSYAAVAALALHCVWGQSLTLERFVLDELRAEQLSDPKPSSQREAELLEQALSFAPYDEATQLEFANALARSGNSAEAFAHARRATLLVHGNAAAVALMAALREDGRMSRFGRALELDPYNHPEFYFAFASAVPTPEQRYEILKLGIERIPMESPIQPDHIRYPDWHGFNPLWAKWWNQLAQLESDPAQKKKYQEIAARFRGSLSQANIPKD